METIEFFVTAKPFVTVVHVISVVSGMGAALMSDILFTFYGKDKNLSLTEVRTLNILSNTVWISLSLIILSGIGLFFSNVPLYMESTKFLAKMSIIVVLLANGLVLHKHVSKVMAQPHFLSSNRFSGTRRLAFACGAISVISWLILCTLGVLDSLPYAYTTIMSAYGSVIIVGILVALMVEQVTFRKG